MVQVRVRDSYRMKAAQFLRRDEWVLLMLANLDPRIQQDLVPPIADEHAAAPDLAGAPVKRDFQSITIKPNTHYFPRAHI